MQDNTLYMITGILVKGGILVNRRVEEAHEAMCARMLWNQVCQPLHNSMCTCCVPRPPGKFMVALLYEQDCLSYYQW